MISAAPNVGYIQEPFNIGLTEGINPEPFKYWFQYISDENADNYKAKIENILKFKYPIIKNILKLKTIGRGKRFIEDSGRFFFYRITKARPLIKDPIAFFSAEWLNKNFSCDVVVLIRHPAAFCSSLKIKKWDFDFSNFSDQPLLMEKFLGPFKNEIEEFNINEKDIIDQGILLWNCIHYTMSQYKKNNPEWLFIKHEDLSLNPLEQFRTIYKKLNLEFTRRAQSEILESSSPSNPSEQIKGNELMRNSKKNVMNWKKRLTKEEINRIKEGTSEISSLLYTEEEW
jgi:hypothetical protein